MSPTKVMLIILLRAVLCLLVSAACYFMFTAVLGATGQASNTRVIWAMTVLTSSVIWAFAFVRPAFFALTGLLADAVHALRWRDENGRYYAFDGQKIRVVVVEGEPWVAEADVLKVLGPKALRHLNWQKMPADEYGEILGADLKGFSEKGVEKLFTGKSDAFSLRFRKFLIRDVFFPFRRARERGLPPPLA